MKLQNCIVFSVFARWLSFRAKGLHPRSPKRTVFDIRPSLRTKGRCRHLRVLLHICASDTHDPCRRLPRPRKIPISPHVYASDTRRGCSSPRQIRIALHVCASGIHDLRRRLRVTKTSLHFTTRFPQRVGRHQDKFAFHHTFVRLTRRISAGWPAPAALRETSEELEK